jgi:hypothetical protein
MRQYVLTYRILGSAKIPRSRVLCYRDDYPIAYLPTIYGSPSGHIWYMSYPSVKVKGKFWIADSEKFDRKATNREWLVLKDMDRRRWWLDHYDEIHKGCLNKLRD